MASSNPYPYGLGDPATFSDPGGAYGIEYALLDYRAAKGSDAQKLIGCGIGVLGAEIEIGFSIAAHLPATTDVVAMIVGVVAGCVIGGASAKAGPIGQIFIAPGAGAILGGGIDLINTYVCGTRHPEAWNPSHAIAVGLATLSVGAIAGVVFTAYDGVDPPLLDQFGIATLTGVFAALLDRVTPGAPGGASC